MRYIKLYEEFKHDEVHDVMMSICNEVSFKESEVYPSSERVRVYETSERVDFDPKQYEEYLSGWTIKQYDTLIVFYDGDKKRAALDWLGFVYGVLRPLDIENRLVYVDKAGNPLLMCYNGVPKKYDLVYQELLAYQDSERDMVKNRKKTEPITDYCFVHFTRIWSFLMYIMELNWEEVMDIVQSWILDKYRLDKIPHYIFDYAWPNIINIE